MKDIKAVRGSDLVRAMVAEGEHEHQDFKFAISDARKIARSISAFANNGGGRLLIGVKDNGVIAGVRNEEDAYVVELAASRYCRPEQSVQFRAYKVDGTAIVIVADIAAATARPVLAGEPDGSWRAYYRVADENIAAHPLMVRAWRMACVPTNIDSGTARVLAYIEACRHPRHSPRPAHIASLGRKRRGKPRRHRTRRIHIPRRELPHRPRMIFFKHGIAPQGACKRYLYY